MCIRDRSLKKPFANIADEFGISSTTVKRIFTEYVKEQEAQMIFATPRILGIDEVHLNKQMRAVFTDIEGLKVLDILPKRNKEDIIAFLMKLPNNCLLYTSRCV